MNATNIRELPQRKKALIAIGGLAAAALAFIAVKQLSAPTTVAEPVEVSATPRFEDGRIFLPAAFVEREKISYATATTQALTPEIHVTGVVAWDARRVAAIGARIQGRLRTLTKVEGESVAVDEVLGELESVELGKAQAEVQKVRAREQVARLDAERERKLADAKISPERDAQFAAANAEALTAERVAAEKAVAALGGTVGSEVGILRLRSPIAGKVVTVKARRGETVDPTDTVFVVADLSRVWVEFSVYERDISSISENDEVELHIAANRGRKFIGKVSHISETIDESTRAAMVRVELDNKDGALRPGLSVVGTISATRPRSDTLTIPSDAVTRIDGKPTVFVSIGDNQIEPRVVKLGAEDADQVAIIDGLKADERVIVKGLLAVKAEVFR